MSIKVYYLVQGFSDVFVIGDLAELTLPTRIDRQRDREDIFAAAEIMIAFRVCVVSVLIAL